MSWGKDIRDPVAKCEGPPKGHGLGRVVPILRRQVYLRGVFLNNQAVLWKGVYTPPGIGALRKSSALGSPLVTEKSNLMWVYTRTRAPVLQSPAKGGGCPPSPPPAPECVGGSVSLKVIQNLRGSFRILWVEDKCLRGENTHKKRDPGSYS